MTNSAVNPGWLKADRFTSLRDGLCVAFFERVHSHNQKDVAHENVTASQIVTPNRIV